MYVYKVMLHGREIDKVFYGTKQDLDDVKRSLINHDGYNPSITIVQECNTRRKGE